MAPSQGLQPIRKKTDFTVLPGMSVGMLLQVQFEGLGSSQSLLIGMDFGNFIIIRTPPLMGIKTKLFQKNHGIIRYLFSGHVYAFHCTLLSVIAEPYRLSILSYPDVFENMNLRKHERIPCIIASEVNTNGWINKGIVSNISMGGCSFEFDRSNHRGFPDIKITDEVSIDLFLREGGAATTFKAIVRKVQTDQDSMLIGLQFVAAETTETAVKVETELKAYLATLEQS